MQLWHLSQASPSLVWFSQLMVLANILAQVVFPTPLGPQNKKGMRQLLVPDGVLQSGRDMRLPNDRVESLGSVFPG